ncbi:hypothetical protein V1477_011585 [Vespula maculifrons]|uniref:Uncharacterized protein n=1 Tax=Vespula maculifrons TaxID=7453 RepID=A0ABD2BZL3_VESMC
MEWNTRTSHGVEVAALGDPRANGDSTLKSTIRDAFPLRELQASQQTGDIAPPSTPSASDISRHDRSCLSFAIDYETNISTIYGITLADMSKSIIWRRSRREGEEKKAGTCAHVRGIEFGRERRRGIGKVTRARVRTMKGKRKDGHRVGKPAQKPTPTSSTHRSHPKEIRIMNIEGKPAQKPTPTSSTHRSHPKEIRIMNIEYIFPKKYTYFKSSLIHIRMTSAKISKSTREDRFSKSPERAKSVCNKKRKYKVLKI